jgi:hypothetical protein
MRTAFILTGALLAGFGRPALSQEWTTFVEPQFGTRLQLPSEVFTVHEGPAYKGIGEQHRTHDGRSALFETSQQSAARNSRLRASDPIILRDLSSV